MQRNSVQDELTHLYYAAVCGKMVIHKLSQMKPAQTGALLFIDPDDFKEIDDRCGYQVENPVRQQFVKHHSDVFRGERVIARIGGKNLLPICIGQKRITPSMSRRGNPYDNAMAEDFFSILKTECIYRHKPTTLSQANEVIDRYIHFYNHERIS